MSDINLLPEDLKKKQKKILEDRDNFNLDEIEFTAGEKLKKEVNFTPKVSLKNNISKWFKPKINSQSSPSNNKDVYRSDKEISKKYNQAHNLESNLERNNEDSKINKDFSLKSSKRDSQKIFSEKPHDQKNEAVSVVSKVAVPKVKDSFKELDNKFKKDKVLKPVVAVKKSSSKGSKVEDEIFFKRIIKYLKHWLDKFKEKKTDNNKKDQGLNVNLLPFGANVPTTKKMASILVITFILSSSLIFIIYFGVYIYQKNIVRDYSESKNELTMYGQDIEKYDNLIHEITAWKKRIQEIENLLDKHIYWTEFLKKLEKNTLPSVHFSSFAGRVGSPITLEATAPDYQTVAKQWIRLENAKDFVKDIKISGASMSSRDDQLSVNFSLSLDFVDGVFYKNTK